ncbi:DoxX family protein [Gordonia sp. CPCC 206044]|uniref:DoxX family protein n=1 Tax=Gordonia sp. CPCC 206044 TaxID=3140793 RepID=UPI003AF39265
MNVAYVVIAIITVVINAVIAGADYLRAPFVLANSAEVNVPPAWLPWLATSKAAGALGVLVGLVADRPTLVTVAAAGLTLFFVGAIVFHVRARVFYNLAFPGLFLAAAVATLALAAGQT